MTLPVYEVTVEETVAGKTPKKIGAVEGSHRFEIDELIDAGIDHWRMYCGMDRVKRDKTGKKYGQPSIEAIKKDPDLIDWDAWDRSFRREDGYFWSSDSPVKASISLYAMLEQLKDHGITPLVALRPVGNHDGPEWAQKLNPPKTAADWNEWWAFVFGWVYFANVRNSLNVHDWQVHNEPDNREQGWAGSLEDYILLTRYTADAIRSVYRTYLPDREYRLYAPVSRQPNEWVRESIRRNREIIDVINWHCYGSSIEGARRIRRWLATHGGGKPLTPQHLSEWGSWQSEYVTVDDSLTHAHRMIEHTLKDAYIEGTTVFPFYDWTPEMKGLVAPDGRKREFYWAFRLMTRGLRDGRIKYDLQENMPKNRRVSIIVTKDEKTDTFFAQFINRDSDGFAIDLDLSLHRTSASVTLREYNRAVKDEVTGRETLKNGRLTVSVPPRSIVQLIIPG